MSETTKIGWTDHTGGPWLGCTEVSPGCANCYSRELTENKFGFCKDAEHVGIMRRAYQRQGFTDWQTRPVWGRNAPRVLTKGFWTETVRLNRKAAAGSGDALVAGTSDAATGASRPLPRPRIFPSLIDVWDDMPAGILDQEGNWLVVAEVRARFLDLVRTTPHLDWLLLTKRPEQVAGALGAAADYTANHCSPNHAALADWIHDWATGAAPPRNVWFGFSAENNDCLWKRWGYAKLEPAVQHFVSCEPLLEDLSGTLETVLIEARTVGLKLWPIIGGESGPGRRDCGVDAIVNAARVARAQGVPVYVKQDCAFKSEQQGRIPAAVWAWKEFPGQLAE